MGWISYSARRQINIDIPFHKFNFKWAACNCRVRVSRTAHAFFRRFDWMNFRIGVCTGKHRTIAVYSFTWMGSHSSSMLNYYSSLIFSNICIFSIEPIGQYVSEKYSFDFVWLWLSTIDLVIPLYSCSRKFSALLRPHYSRETENGCNFY